MRTIAVTGNETIRIGRVGENRAVQIIWSGLLEKWRELYGEGTVQLAVRRPKDTAPYPVVCEVSENDVTWTVQAADTARHGIGECELTYLVGEKIAKSQTWATEILRSLTEDEIAEPPDDPAKTWYMEIRQEIGNLDDLETEDKTNLVSAINEAAQSGGGGGTFDHSKLSNRDAADQHPMSAIAGLEKALEDKQPAGAYLTDKDLDTTLKKTGKAADAAEVGKRLSSLTEEKVNLPKDDSGAVQNGTDGQILQTNGDGTTQWVDKPNGGTALTVTNTASVGQTVKITAVDENGQPAEWEAVDMAGGGEGSFNLIDTYDVSTGALSYETTGLSLNEIVIVLETAGNWIAQNLYINGTKLPLRAKIAAAAIWLRKLVGGIFQYIEPRGASDNLALTTAVPIPGDKIETIKVEFSGVTGGIIKIYGR